MALVYTDTTKRAEAMNKSRLLKIAQKTRDKGISVGDVIAGAEALAPQHYTYQRDTLAVELASLLHELLHNEGARIPATLADSLIATLSAER